jgi:hypothetical protein
MSCFFISRVIIALAALMQSIYILVPSHKIFYIPRTCSDFFN